MNFSLLENRSTNKGTVVPQSDDARIRIWGKGIPCPPTVCIAKRQEDCKLFHPDSSNHLNYRRKTNLCLFPLSSWLYLQWMLYIQQFNHASVIILFCFFWKIKPVRWISLYDTLALCVAVVSCLRNPLEWKYCLKMERTRKRLTCETLVVDTKHNKRSKVSYTFV